MSLRDAFARMAASVCVATRGAPGLTHGVTLTSVVGLALQPPLLGFALSRSSRLLPGLESGARLGITVLADGQEAIAANCATPHRGPLAERLVERDARGTPTVAGGAAAFHLRVTQRLPVGDHELVVAEIDDASTGAAGPLLYFERSYSHVCAPSVERTRS